MRLLYVLCEVDKFFFTSFMLNTTLRMLKDGVRLRFYAAVSMKNVPFKKEKKDNLYPIQSVTIKGLPDGFLLSDIQNVEPKSIALHMYNQV